MSDGAKPTNVYIDGLNFYYGAMKEPADKWLDFRKFIEMSFPDEYIGEVNYYSANVKGRWKGDLAPDRHHAYLRALDATVGINVHLGRFHVRPKWKTLADRRLTPDRLFRPYFQPREEFVRMWDDKVQRRLGMSSLALVEIFEEKRSDVSLAVHLVRDAILGKMDAAIVVSNDSDLMEAVKVAVEHDVPVCVMNPVLGRKSGTLDGVATSTMGVDRSLFPLCQLPDRVITQKGKVLNRPREWG